MDMVMREQIAAAQLNDWRKLAQALHTRHIVADQEGNRGVLCVADAPPED